MAATARCKPRFPRRGGDATSVGVLIVLAVGIAGCGASAAEGELAVRYEHSIERVADIRGTSPKFRGTVAFATLTTRPMPGDADVARVNAGRMSTWLAERRAGHRAANPFEDCRASANYHRCVVDKLLGGAEIPPTPEGLIQAIDSFRAVGVERALRSSMWGFVFMYPDHPQAEAYRTELGTTREEVERRTPPRDPGE